MPSHLKVPHWKKLSPSQVYVKHWLFDTNHDQKGVVKRGGQNLHVVAVTVQTTSHAFAVWGSRNVGKGPTVAATT